MPNAFPFLTAYDPPGTSEGSLDPLGLYQLADQLAVQLVPAVRERMQRIRFLTAMAVGTLVTEGLEGDPRHPDAAPFLVWEWLVVEALMREMRNDPRVLGVPGTLVTRHALDAHGYLDARSYLKTPRIFGFHGVYKRLAMQIGVVDVHLGPGPHADGLADAWARGMGFMGLDDAKPLLSRWSTAIRRSVEEKPSRTKPAWSNDLWVELASAFAPWAAKAQEKRYLRGLLLEPGEKRMGALPEIWKLQDGFKDDDYREERLHDRLEKLEPGYVPLLRAIRAYETFGRALQDAFDVLKTEAAAHDANGFAVSAIARDSDFAQSMKGLHKRFEVSHRALGDLPTTSVSLQNLFDRRFQPFAEPMDPADCALALCTHHEEIQRAKSAEGKRPWFDRIGNDRIYIRHAYREPRCNIEPSRYVHEYRGWPIRRFCLDLS